MIQIINTRSIIGTCEKIFVIERLISKINQNYFIIVTTIMHESYLISFKKESKHNEIKKVVEDKKNGKLREQ
jgi:hypothetical protein